MTEEQKLKALQQKLDGKSWTELDRIYGCNVRDSIRAIYRKAQKGKGKPYNLLADLKRGFDMTEYAALHGKTVEAIEAELSDLMSNGYNVSQIGTQRLLDTTARATGLFHDNEWNGDKVIRFAVVSDTHLGSKFQQITHLNNFYDLCMEEGVTDIYHCGDISDGYYTNRQGQIYELHKHGFDEQSNYIIEHYPKRDGITTHFIIGNHDVTHIRNGGANIGIKIDNQRDDMHYLGNSYARIMLTPNCSMDLRHPADGSSYALSYKIQKYIDVLQGGSKPNILFQGHYHKNCYVLYRNIHAILIGSFEAQTPFMAGKGLYGDMSGAIVTIHVDADGTVNRFSPVVVGYYEALQDDY